MNKFYIKDNESGYWLNHAGHFVKDKRYRRSFDSCDEAEIYHFIGYSIVEDDDMQDAPGAAITATSTIEEYDRSRKTCFADGDIAEGRFVKEVSSDGLTTTWYPVPGTLRRVY